MSKHSYLALASASIFALATSATFAQTADETIDEVVVLSSPFKKSSDEIISQTHVITSSKIDKNAGTTLGDIIKTIPGVSVASHGPEVGRPVIRGLSGRRTGSLVNGMTAGDISDTANDHANIINYFDINRVEVLKGPSALRYGPYATSGVVNSFNRLLDADATNSYEISVGGSTVADGSTGAIYGVRSFNNMSVAISGFDQASEEIKIPTHAESYYELTEEGEEIVDVSQDVANTAANRMALAHLFRSRARSQTSLFLQTPSQNLMAFQGMLTMKKREKRKKSTVKRASKSSSTKRLFAVSLSTNWRQLLIQWKLVCM